MRALGDYLQVKCHACVGGTSVREDQRILQVLPIERSHAVFCLFARPQRT